jgi:peroxiredoxin
VADGPAVVVFYRGGWCPYCNLALRTYEAELLPELARYGARLVAISPQNPDQSLSMSEKARLSFTVLSDRGAALAYRLGIAYTPTPELLRAQRALGLDLMKVNATVDLPLPAVLIIDSDRTVRFVDPCADYTQRTEVQAILGALERLGGAGNTPPTTISDGAP